MAAPRSRRSDELGELVRGRLELAADDIPDGRFGTMWSAIDRELDRHPVATSAGSGIWSRIARFLEHYRSQIITGAVSAGAVAALALVLRGGGSTTSHRAGQAPIDVRPVVHRPAEIEALDTPGGTGTVFNLDDEDGSTTVIWVTPEDTVEGI